MISISTPFLQDSFVLFPPQRRRSYHRPSTRTSSPVGRNSFWWPTNVRTTLTNEFFHLFGPSLLNKLQGNSLPPWLASVQRRVLSVRTTMRNGGRNVENCFHETFCRHSGKIYLDFDRQRDHENHICARLPLKNHSISLSLSLYFRIFVRLPIAFTALLTV